MSYVPTDYYPFSLIEPCSSCGGREGAACRFHPRKRAPSTPRQEVKCKTCVARACSSVYFKELEDVLSDNTESANKELKRICEAAKRSDDPRKFAIASARANAHKRGIEFQEEAIPTYTGTCECCGVELRRDMEMRRNTPSVDRIDSSKGYVRGNVAWVCCSCNSKKSSFNADHILRLFFYVSKDTSRPVCQDKTLMKNVIVVLADLIAHADTKTLSAAE